MVSLGEARVLALFLFHTWRTFSAVTLQCCHSGLDPESIDSSGFDFIA
jgi:hypothetical protein